MRDIGDAIVSGQIFTIAQPSVENGIEAPRLVLVTVDDRRDLLRKIAEEDIGLTLHRADAAHLQHQPLNDRRPRLSIAWQQACGLLGEIDKNGARLEHGEIFLIAVDDRWNASV